MSDMVWKKLKREILKIKLHNRKPGYPIDYWEANTDANLKRHKNVISDSKVWGKIFCLSGLSLLKKL